MFGSGDFRTAQTAGAAYFDSFGSETQGRLHNAFHRAAESNASFQLLSNAVRNQLCVQFRFSYFQNVQLNFGSGHGLNFFSQSFDILTFFTDNDTGSCRVNGDSGLFRRTFDDDSADAGLSQFLFQEFFNFNVFMQVTGIVVVGIPAGIPGTVNTKNEDL